MNRPKIHEIAKQIDDMNLLTTKYIIDLEKYCDELELNNGYITMHADAFLDEIKKLNKALDKATDELAINGKMVGMTKDFIMYSKKATKEEWEEWLLNGE